MMFFFSPDIPSVVSHGDDMALSVPPDRYWRLHSRQVVSDPQVHGGSIRPGVWPHCGGGLFLAPGGDRAGQTGQTANLGHCRTGEVQVQMQLFSFAESNSPAKVCVCVCAGLSLVRTIGTQWVASCSSTSQTTGPSRTSTTGWRRPRATSSPTASSFCWSATSVTWRPCARSPGRRPRSWPGPSGCATWRPRRWTLSTWRRWISTGTIIFEWFHNSHFLIRPSWIWPGTSLSWSGAETLKSRMAGRASRADSSPTSSIPLRRSPRETTSACADWVMRDKGLRHLWTQLYLYTAVVEAQETS